MIFADRIAAAEKLAKVLAEYHDKNPLVLAIPRGAVPMAKVIAEQLNGGMDVQFRLLNHHKTSPAIKSGNDDR